MLTIKAKDFIRLFVLELILVQKESVFDLWDNETVDLPNNYMTLLDEVTSDEVKKVKYQNIIPIEEKEEWKFEVTSGLCDFLNSTGVTHSYKDGCIRMNLNRDAISRILLDKRFSYSQKGQVASLAEDFLLTKQKTRPKQKTYV